MFVGTNGVITSFPNNGEKCCVSCEHWCGGREISYIGSAATSKSKESALCELKRTVVFPQQGCTIHYQKWHLLK